MSVLRTKLRRDLSGRRWQVGAVLLTVVLGVMLYAASYDAYLNLERSYQRTYDRLAFADLTVNGGDAAAIASAADGTAGVEAVQQRVQADVPFRVGGSQRLLGRVVGLPAASQPAVNRVDLTAGTYLDPTSDNAVLVEQHMADYFGLAPGDELEVLLGGRWVRVSVVGTAVSPEYLWPARSRQEILTTADDFGVLFVPEALAEKAGSGVVVPQVLVRYGSGSDAAVLDGGLGRAAAAAGAADVVTQEDQPSNAALQEDVNGFGELSLMFPLLFLGAAALATYMLLSRLVTSERMQIGALRANGLSRRVVLRHYLAFGLVIGASGALVGAVLGASLGALITGVYTSSLSIPDTVVGFHPGTAAVGVTFGVVAGLAAAWAPARAALRVSPADAMRGDTPTHGGRVSLVERVLPPLRRLPSRWRMALRGVGRNPRRSLSTVIGVVLGLVLVFVSWGMVDTTEVLLDRQFGEVERQSSQLFYEGPVTDADVRAAAAVPGVRGVESVAQLAVAVSAGAPDAGSTGYGTQIVAFPPDTTMHGFVAPDGSSMALPADGVLLGSAAGHRLDVGVGDPVTLSFPTLGTSVETSVSGFVSEPLGTSAYVARPALEGLLAAAQPAVGSGVLSQPGVGSVMVQVAGGAGPADVHSELASLPGVSVVVDSRALYDVAQSLLTFFYIFVGVMLVFGALLAFALIFTTMSVNIAERTGELATMRASGFGLGSIARLLTGENVLLTVVGIVVGLPAAILTASVFMSSFSSDLFQFDL
ncbi:MAG: ABC transporter permease, partial [Actinomycetota bacterium]|nr:ABC transporter permease [Actinomycetota bacterium]